MGTQLKNKTEMTLLKKKIQSHSECTLDFNEKEKSVLIRTGQGVRNEKMPLCLMEIKIIDLQRAEFKDTPKIRVKIYAILPKCYCSNSELYQVVCIGHMSLYAHLTTSRHGPNETMDSVLGESLPRCGLTSGKV